MRWFGIVVVCLLAVLLTLGCHRTGSDQEAPPDDPVWFRDDTAAVKLDFRHEAGQTGSYFFPQIMGSGGALLDFDNDGLFDLYLIQNAGPKSVAAIVCFANTRTVISRMSVPAPDWTSLDTVWA